MRKPLIIGTGLGLIICVAVLMIDTTILLQRPDRFMNQTSTAIVATNNAVEGQIHTCSVICAATGGQASCENTDYVCERSITWTPTYTPVGMPTMNSAFATSVAIQHTQKAVNTVVAVCATMYHQIGSEDYCPNRWLQSLTKTPTKEK